MNHGPWPTLESHSTNSHNLRTRDTLFPNRMSLLRDFELTEWRFPLPTERNNQQLRRSCIAYTWIVYQMLLYLLFLHLFPIFFSSFISSIGADWGQIAQNCYFRFVKFQNDVVYLKPHYKLPSNDFIYYVRYKARNYPANMVYLAPWSQFACLYTEYRAFKL